MGHLPRQRFNQYGHGPLLVRATTTATEVLFLGLFLFSLGGCGRSQLGGPDAGPAPDAEPPPRDCLDDIDCDDTNPCNGRERCVEGSCAAGEPIICDDGVDCTADTCDETTGECLALPDHDQCPPNATCDPVEGCHLQVCLDDGDCDDGGFCNGAEYCQGGYCQPSEPVICNDGIDCTIDICDEELDSCAAVPDDDVCDDGRRCTGQELCDPTLGCQTIPWDCDDGDRCTTDFCDPDSDRCTHIPADDDRDGWPSCACAPAPCDCNDADVTVNPAMVEQCRDRRDNDCDGLVDCDDRADCSSDPRCVDPICHSHEECSDGLFCNGRELCDDSGRCVPGTPVECGDDIACTLDICVEDSGCQSSPDDGLCDPGERCDPIRGCVDDSCGGDDECDDTLYCNGRERCVDGRCVRGTEIICDDGVDCTADRCNERRDRCVSTPRNERCDDGLFCNGAEQCSAEAGCLRGEDPCVATDCEVAECLEDEDLCLLEPIDRDGDAFFDEACGGTDCDDEDVEINPAALEVCDDGVDNDCDRRADCASPFCFDHPACCVVTGPEVCDDGVDNDCDGRLDCEDLADCRRHLACCEPTGPEVCDDGLDNECDGFTDCSDFLDCRDDPACADCVPELCWDEEDNDCDDLVDCDDPDCAWYPICTATEEERDCVNGIDDDLDGLTDCDDPDCELDPRCSEPDTCDEAEELLAPGTVTGTTELLMGDYFPAEDGAGCRGGYGPEAVYFGSVAEPTMIRIDSFGSSYDTVLYVRAEDCEFGPQVACNDDTGGLQSQLTFLAEPGMVYYLFVDGWSEESWGEYEVHIQLLPVGEEVCDNGVDDDGDGMVDCDDPDCAGHPGCELEPEHGVAGCTDGRDNDGDGLIDCDDTEDCSVVEELGECCNGADDNGNGATDEFACGCVDNGDCATGYCYVDTVWACGPSCSRLGGDVACDFLFPGTGCSAETNTCIYE